MTPDKWAALIVSTLTILGGFLALVRWIVIHYLNELRPNGGNSVKDQVNRLEKRIDEIYSILIERG
jgi:hypothetical protein